MTERTHNEIYDRLGSLEARQDIALKEIARLREAVESASETSKSERREIIARVQSLELINAERSGAEGERNRIAVWALRLMKWTLPIIPVGSLAAAIVWIGNHWPWGVAP